MGASGYSYERMCERQDVVARAGELSAKTFIIDVEPMVAYWDTSQEALDQGIANIVDQVRTAPGLEVVCFATNSDRRPSSIQASAPVRVLFVSSARKPVRLAAYRDLPKPGVVIGDQAATDGVLAYRLGYAFLHYTPPMTNTPLGPRAMRQVGRLVLPFLRHRGRRGWPRGSRAGKR
jgi:predicted HAD superfamily phosphohydrolase YqeG